MRQDKRTQALLRAIAHSDSPMVLSDPNLVDNPIIAMNPAFEAMTGYGPDKILGHNCRILQGRGTDPETSKRIGRTVREGHGCVEWIVNHKPGGAAYWNLLFISPVRNAEGEIIHFLGNQLDMTLGLPTWLDEVTFGRAHMTTEIEQEFQTLLADILDEPSATPGGLTKILEHARRLAEVSRTLQHGARPQIPPPGG